MSVPTLDAATLAVVRAVDEAALSALQQKLRATVDALSASQTTTPDGNPSPIAHAEWLAAHHKYWDAKRAFDAAYGIEVPAAPRAAPAPLAMSATERAPFRLEINGRGYYEASLQNLVHVLGSQQTTVIGFDTFRGRIMIAPTTAPDQWRPLTDTDMVQLRETLGREQRFAAIGKELMHDALRLVAERHSFDTAIMWLEGLTWDRTPRVDGFLPNYCGALDDDYSRAVSRYIWTGLAARVLEAGCQLDMVVALQSPQGMHKSTGLQAIVPDAEFFTDGVELQQDDDDFKRLIRGKLVVEIAELAGLSRADVTVVKRTITRRVEEWIEKWQTLPTRYARRCMLFATTNDEKFLPPDDTGQRRWLPVEVARIDRERIATDRSQLWAEGAELWRQDRAHNPKGGVLYADAERLAAGRHHRYEATDVWLEDIERWLNTPEYPLTPNEPPRPPPGTRPLALNEVLAGALRLPPAMMDAKGEKRAARVMRQLGYEKRDVKVGGRGLKRWVRVAP